MKKKTYDILNAGPNNRFMANGKIVSNSSAGCQVQNLPRPIKAVGKLIKKTPNHIFDLIDREDYDGIIKEFGSPLPFVASILRNLFSVSNENGGGDGLN